ncbi:MAG: polysaccharide biosynthesis protein [Clostridia bacterium]|nr:polysaccharide biosynthesis protein [Clostridia bacterium]
MVEGKKTVKRSFFSGVLLLSLSTVLVKVVGFVYKIPMLSYLGSVGMGYFHSAYEIYALFCVIATAGLPVALSVLVSAALARNDGKSVGKIFRSSMTVFWIIGLLGTGVMVLFAPAFCRMIRSENAYDCMISIAPTVLMVCISSAYRGYFQGYQRMMPTAISQLIEAFGKLIFGVLFAKWAYMNGMEPPKVAAAAGWGLTLGTALSALYLFFEKIIFQKTETYRACEGAEVVVASISTREIWRSLAKLSIPMTLGASAVSLTKLVDMAMILRRLQAIGYSEVMANEAYGSYTALALSVYALLPSLVNSIALPLIPILSAAIETGDRERQAAMIRSSYHLTAVVAIPAALAVSAFAKPILSLLFGGEAEAVVLAAPLLSLLGSSIFLSCMITASNSVLHAYRSVNRPILSMLAGAAVKIVAAYFLIGLPSVGLLGAPISTFLCNLTVVILNLVFASKLQKIDDLVSVFGKPLAAAIPSIGIPLCIYQLMVIRIGENAILTLGSFVLAVVLYLLLACALGAITEDDLMSLPMGKYVCRVLAKIMPRQVQLNLQK